MRAHNRSKHAAKTNSNTKVEDVIVLELYLDESRIGETFCRKLSIKQTTESTLKYRTNRTTFENSLGLQNQVDWNAYIELSNLPGIPLSSEHSGTVECCIFRDVFGEEMYEFVWNSCSSSEELIYQMLMSVVNDAVQVSTLMDLSILNDEIYEVVDDLIYELEADF